MEKYVELDQEKIKHHFVDSNGENIHYVAYIDNLTKKESLKSIPFLLVHGFPEFWYSYRYLIPLLSDPKIVDPNHQHRYRVYAMDLRGYNLSSHPKKVKDYRIRLQIQDILSVINIISPNGKVNLVGHDWGGGFKLGSRQKFSRADSSFIYIELSPGRNLV